MKKLLNNRAVTTALFLAAATCASARECYTPMEWNPKNYVSSLDRNKNFVDDAIDKLPSSGTVGIILCLNACASADDLDRFRTLIGSDYTYRSPYLSILLYENVSVAVAVQLGADPRVGMVEIMRQSTTANDVATRAAKIRSSAEYAGNNVEDLYALDGTGVNIAIIDTGVDNEPQTTADPVHESFPIGKFVAGAEFWMDMDPDDENNHGTHVAGIALGTGGPGGIYRGNAPGAGLVDLKIGTANFVDGSFITAFDKVIEKRVEWNIDVFNLSFVSGPLSDGTNALAQHINRIVREGVVAVVSAGNNGPASAIGRLASSDFAITVASANDMGSVDRLDDEISTFSTRGPRLSDGDGITEDELKPDVTAYGENIHSALRDTQSDYVDMSGTSMSAPQVAGLAALILQAKPGMDPLSLKELIQSTAEDYGAPGWDIEFGHGIINGAAALNVAVNSQTDVAFNDYCHNSGNPNWWLSGDIVPVDPNIVEGTPNGITVTIYNNSPTTAANVKVRVGAYDFSNSTSDYDICMHTIASLPPGPYTFTCPWTPEADNLFPSVVHVCLKAYIIYTSDMDYSNNCAQHNVNIQQTYSPALFNVRVVNPTEEDAVMEIVTEPSAQELETMGWTLDMGPATFPMAADDCPRTVTIAMEAARNAQTVPVNVTVRRRTAQGSEVLGGVRLIAKNGNGAPRPPDKANFAGIRHTSLGQARLRSTPEELIVSKIDDAGDDGVEAYLGQADFWRGTLREFDLSKLPNNAAISFSPKGRVGGRDGVTISEMKIQDVRGDAYFSIDFQTASPELMIEVYNGDQLVDSRTNTDGIFAGVGSLPPDIQLTPFRYNAQGAYCEVGLSAATDIEVLGSTSSTVVTGNRIVVYSLVAPALPAYVEKVDILSNGTIPFALSSEAGGAFERIFRPMGNPLLEWKEAGAVLRAGRVKARSAVGVRAEVPSLKRYQLTWPEVDIQKVPTGTHLTVSARGTLRTAGVRDLGAVWTTRVPSGVAISADLAHIGTGDNVALVYEKGRLVYATRNPEMVIGVTSDWPTRGGHGVESNSQAPCFILSWSKSVDLALADGTTVTGDEIHILPERAFDQLVGVSELGVYVVGLEELQIIGEEAASGLPVSVETPERELPFRLYQNYPNPFDQRTIFKFDLLSEARVELEIYNLLGDKVADVLMQQMQQGTHEVEWKRPTASLPSGTYIYRMKVQPVNSGETFEIQRQMVILD